MIPLMQRMRSTPRRGIFLAAGLSLLLFAGCFFIVHGRGVRDCADDLSALALKSDTHQGLAVLGHLRSPGAVEPEVYFTASTGLSEPD
jgi:hypothetical protein